MKSAIVPNPSTRGGRRRVNVTDRALRYRANANPPAGPRICHYCGKPGGRMDIDHVDGREEHGNPENLSYACRPCNTAKGITFKRAGIGRRTRQYNPAAAEGPGARSSGQWYEAVMATKGLSNMDLQAAIALIHATPQEDRARFASELYSHRQKKPKRTSQPKTKERARQRQAARRAKRSAGEEVPF